MAGYGWGGFSNGSIPYDAMVYCRGAWLEPTAAYWAEAMATVFEHERGKPLMFLGYSEGFRALGNPGDYAAGIGNTQYFYYERKKANPGAPAAATPRGSIHGWALAVDVDLTYLTAEDIEWLHTRGRAFGWNWDTTGRPNDEPWHLDFNLTPTEPFDPANYQKEDTLSAAEVADIKDHTQKAVNNLWKDVQGLFGPLDDDEARIKDATRREGRPWRLFRNTDKTDTAPDAYVAIAYTLEPSDSRQVIFLSESEAKAIGSRYLMTADTPENAQRLDGVAIATAIRLARGTDQVYDADAQPE
jgi:hypothetical protein